MIRGWILSALALVAGCGFDSSGGGSGSAGDDDDGSSDPSTAADVSTAGTTAVTGADDDDTASTGAEATTSGSSTSDADTGDVPDVGCPSPLPGDWVFCSDFEADGAEDDFARWETADGRMGITEGVGREGSHALQFAYTTDDNWAGRAVVEFGDFPDDDVRHAPGERFGELWVRMYLRTQADWPGLGAGDLFGLHVTTDVDDQRTSAVLVSLYTDEAAQVIGVHPSRCFQAGDPGCAARMPLEAIFGTTPVYATRRADVWQCIVVHVALDARGPDGAIALVVDDNPEASRSDYAFVEGWAGEGWNALEITGSWPNGNPPAVQRWIDDVAIATSPLDCT